MIKHFFKITFRNLARYKGFSLINLAGLTLGITGCLLIGLFVWDELQYDRFHKEGNRIFRIYNRSTREGNTENIASTPPAFSTTLKQEFPEVEQTMRITNIYQQSLF